MARAIGTLWRDYRTMMSNRRFRQLFGATELAVPEVCSRNAAGVIAGVVNNHENSPVLIIGIPQMVDGRAKP
jgi:hypothetical protein